MQLAGEAGDPAGMVARLPELRRQFELLALALQDL
jgi:hypothetical protein